MRNSLAKHGGLHQNPLEGVPNRERESLVGEQSRIVNRMKAALVRLGIRDFNPKLKKAAGQ